MALVQGPWPTKEDELPGGPQPPDNGDMNARVTALETRLDTILPTLASKADVAELRADVAKGQSDTHKGFSDMVKWMVGVAFTGIAVVISAVTFLFAQAKPQQQAAQATPPIIINVPQAPAAAPAQPAK